MSHDGIVRVERSVHTTGFLYLTSSDPDWSKSGALQAGTTSWILDYFAVVLMRRLLCMVFKNIESLCT